MHRIGRVGRSWAAAAIIGTAVGLAGCMQVGSQDFPQATAGFQPKGTYDVSFDRAWGGVVAALNANKIGIATTSKDTGQITTDYVAGVEELYGLGLIGGESTRYRYRVFIARQGNGRTTITVDCMLEASTSGGGLSDSAGINGAFTDVSGQNQETVSKLRNWLYQQIEQKL